MGRKHKQLPGRHLDPEEEDDEDELWDEYDEDDLDEEEDYDVEDDYEGELSFKPNDYEDNPIDNWETEEGAQGKTASPGNKALIVSTFRNQRGDKKGPMDYRFPVGLTDY